MKKSLTVISPHLLEVNPDLRIFLFCVHDWLAHQVSEPYWWNSYGGSLNDVILTRTTDRGYPLSQWIANVVNAPLTIGTLLYRHYLVQQATAEEIFTTPNYSPLYVILASTLTNAIAFSPLSAPHLWENIDTDLHPINILRIKRPLINQHVHRLAMRDDTTDQQLIRDHGLLSSLSLLYGLYLVRVILIHEMTIRPEGHLGTILGSLSDTLTNLKGVFNNVESRWLSVDV